MEPGTTTVEIYGQKYTVRSDDDAEHVERVAAYVDERMREVARASSQVTSLRVAILAALNIADELFRERQGVSEALETRARSLADALEQTISEASSGESETGDGEDHDGGSDSGEDSTTGGP